MRLASFGPRTAWTMVELLVVAALIAVLVGLSFGGIQKVRSSADRTVCADRLRQIGVAMHHYHSAAGAFPPGLRSDQPTEAMPYLAWCARLLPYLDHNALWSDVEGAFQRDRDFLNTQFHTRAKEVIPAFICPSDPRTRKAMDFGRGQLQGFTSYQGVAGTHSYSRDGILYVDSRVAVSEVTDGTSNTVLIGERPPSADLLFGWWYAGWGFRRDGICDMVLAVDTRNDVSAAWGCSISGGFPFQAGRIQDQCSMFHFWSPHRQGAHFLFADGSTRFLTYDADRILKSLATRSGGESASID